MARMPKHRELDLFDYRGVMTGEIRVETNDPDNVGRHLEQVVADQCDAELDLFEEPDLPELGVNIKSGGLRTAQNTIGSISAQRFDAMSTEQRYQWFKDHSERWHYIPRCDELGLTGGSYNINASEGTHAGELLKSQFEDVCNKIDYFVLTSTDINWPRCVSDDKGLWAEYDRKNNLWKFRQSRVNRRRVELRDNMFDNVFEL